MTDVAGWLDLAWSIAELLLLIVVVGLVIWVVFVWQEKQMDRTARRRDGMTAERRERERDRLVRSLAEIRRVQEGAMEDYQRVMRESAEEKMADIINQDGTPWDGRKR